MVGISSKLLRSTLVLLIFYGAIALIAFFSMTPDSLTKWLTYLGEAPDSAITLANLNSILIEKISIRVTETAPYFAGGLVVSFLFAWGLILSKKSLFERRGEESEEHYRGVSVTISQLPKVREPEKKKLRLKIPKSVKKEHLPLLKDLLAYLNAHPDAFVGSGHDSSLLEHTLSVIEKALEFPDADPLLVLAAAAHDIGKTTSHEKINGKWVRKKLHDKESARILVSFDSWWRMDETERSILVHAVRYEHSKWSLPYQIPGLVNDEIARTKKLLDQLQIIDGITTMEEKEAVLQDIDVGQAVLDAFFKALPEIPFQIQGMKRGISAGGWRQGNRLYLIEHRIRELSLNYMDEHQAAALGGMYREKGQVTAYSQALFEVLEEKGWLIRTLGTQLKADSEVKEMTVPLHFPLWRIMAGTANFNAIFVVELPEEYHYTYPKESQYTVTVTGPLSSNPHSPKTAKKKPKKDQPPLKVEIKPVSVEQSSESPKEVKIEKPKKEQSALKVEIKPVSNDGNSRKDAMETLMENTEVAETGKPAMETVKETAKETGGNTRETKETLVETSGKVRKAERLPKEAGKSGREAERPAKEKPKGKMLVSIPPKQPLGDAKSERKPSVKNQTEAKKQGYKGESKTKKPERLIINLPPVDDAKPQVKLGSESKPEAPKLEVSQVEEKQEREVVTNALIDEFNEIDNMDFDDAFDEMDGANFNEAASDTHESDKDTFYL